MKIDIEVPPHIDKLTKQPKTMLQLEYDLNTKRPIVSVNSSSLDLLQTCMRKSYYILERKLTSNVESPATLYGSAIHAGLEHWYSGKPKDRLITKECVKNFELMSFGNPSEHDDCLACESIVEFCKVAAPLQSLDEYDKRSIPTGVWTLEHYFKRYLDDPFIVYRDEQGPMIERKFKFKLVDNPDYIINIFGTIDVVLQNEQTGQILVCDHKTTSIMGNDFYNRLKPNHQYTGYIMGANECLNIDTDVFMVNGLQVKGKPKTARGTIPNYTRQITSRTKEDFDEFKTTIKYYVEQYLKCKASGFWPIGPVNACASYGGCRYLDVCSVPSNLHESILSNKFSQGAYQ